MTFEIPNPHDACFKDLFSRPEFVQSFIENYIPFEIREIYALLETIPDKDKIKDYLQAIVQYVALAGPISQDKLGEYTRRLPGGEEAMQTAAEQIRKEVYNEIAKDQEKLLAEREQRGEIKGKLEYAHESLIDVANDLFGPLSNSLQAKIKSIQSIENLRALNRKVHKTSSLEEFTELVNRAVEN